MTYLLDTCILSEARKSNYPKSEKIKLWLDECPETNTFISVITLGEIQAGISKLNQNEQRKKALFENWLLTDLIPRFEHRILSIDIHTCSIWGQLRGEAQKNGHPLPAIDMLIAATAIQHRLVLVTINTKDFVSTGVSLLNPYTDL